MGATAIGGTRLAVPDLAFPRGPSSRRLVGETNAGAGGSGKTDSENSLTLAGEDGLLLPEVEIAGSGVNWAA
jgi:hypothetical protein